MNNQTSIGKEFHANVICTELLKHAQNVLTVQFNVLIFRLISILDRQLSEQLSEVIQHKKFKQLEASWRSVEMLVALPFSSRRVSVKILDISWHRLSNDLNSSFDIRQSVLFRKLYSNEFDTAGGTPFGVIVVDHQIASDYNEEISNDDLYTLQLLSEVGEVSMCPVIMGVDELFFGDDPDRQLHDCQRASRILESEDFSPWQLLRKKESARFLHLVLPEYQLRLPYYQYITGFIFSEEYHRDYALWGNSAYLLAANIINEFDRISWFGFLRSYDKSGSYGAIVQQTIVSKVDIYSEDSGFWSEQGFVPLSSLYLSGQKGFFGNQSVYKTKNETSRLLGMLQTNLMACRFGHYIKAQIRDLVGQYNSIDDCKHSLERWLKNYVSDVDYGEDDILARYPLKSCEIQIIPSLQDQTHYICHIIIQPQYQYEMMNVKVVLSTPLKDLGVFSL